jgi:methanethiol S-methyltransferase
MISTTEMPTPAGRRRRAALSATVAGTAYLAFVAVLVYAVGFVAGSTVPRTVDSGGPHAGRWSAVAVDVLLLGSFAIQHSAMARPAFKRRWTRLVPSHLERSVYVLLASALLALAFWQWRPLPDVVWQVHAGWARAVLWAVFGAGWLLVVAMTFAIDHLDMLGIRQVGRHLLDRPPTETAFRLPVPYQLVRHPMMTGFFLALLATPQMTAGHLLFALLSCGYIVVGVRLEERDLSASLPEYRKYAAATPRFAPVRLRRSGCPVSFRPGRRERALGRDGLTADRHHADGLGRRAARQQEELDAGRDDERVAGPGGLVVVGETGGHRAAEHEEGLFPGQ